MRFRSKVFLGVFIVLTAFFGWLAYYAQDKGFPREWREWIKSEFAARGVYLDLRRLNLDPLRGLVAKDLVVYEDAEREIPLLTVDQAMLDIDVTRLFDRRNALRSLYIRDAKVTIPLDPKKKLKGKQLRLDNLSARVLMPEGRMEIVRVEADLEQLHLVLRGSVFRPLEAEKKERENEEKDPQEYAEQQKQQLRELRKRGEAIAEFLDELAGLETESNARPRIELEVHGDSRKPEELQVRGNLRSGALTWRRFSCESIDADFEMGADGFLLRNLTIRDENGSFNASAELKPGSKQVEFAVNSSANIHALLGAMVEESALNEVVFYEPPKIEAEGVWHLDRPFDPGNLPLKVIGNLRSDRLTSRGVIFDALSFDFSLDGPNLYLRDARLDHRSGLLTADILRRGDEVNYRAKLGMHPTAFKPFLQQEGSRQFISRWDFHEESAVLVEVEGFGPATRPDEWTTRGSIEMSNCALHGYPIDQLQATLDFERQKHHFRDVVITREDGVIAAKHILLDHEIRMATLEGVEGQIFPVHAVGWFAPKAAKHLLIYDFEEPPFLALHGEMDLRPPSQRNGQPPRHDYHLRFATDGVASYRLFGEDLRLEQPSGQVHISGRSVTLTGFKAGVLGGQVEAAVGIDRSEIAADDNAYLYRIELIVDKLDFHEFAETWSGYKDTEGQLTGSITLHGDSRGGVRSIVGSGEATIMAGDVFSIPAFGPLSNPMSETFPKFHDGFSVAREAVGSFSIDDGVFRIDQFQALTDTFALEGRGEVDLETSEIDLETTINLRGRAAALVKPVSRLVVFKGTGTMSEPEWSLGGMADVAKPITNLTEGLTEKAEGIIRKAGEGLPVPVPIPRIRSGDGLPLPVPIPRIRIGEGILDLGGGDEEEEDEENSESESEGEGEGEE